MQSRDGNTEAKDPSTLGGGDTDTHLIYEGLSRVATDAVMAGAETIIRRCRRRPAASRTRRYIRGP